MRHQRLYEAAFRLPYVAPAGSREEVGYGLAFYRERGEYRIGRLAGADWAGNVYLSNPLPEGYSRLDCISPSGDYLRTWNPIHAMSISKIATVDSGVVWARLYGGFADGCRCVPLVAYSPSDLAPMFDWRDSLPPPIEYALAKDGIVDRNGALSDRAQLIDISSDSRSVYLLFRLLGPAEPHEWIVEVDGTRDRILRSSVIQGSLEGSKGGPVSVLAPDGGVFSLASDLEGFDSTAWTKLWISKCGIKHGQPVVDRSGGHGAWATAVKALDPLFPPLEISGPALPELSIGNADRAYLEFSRSDPSGLVHKFQVDGERIAWQSTDGDGERCMVVLDRNGNFVTTTGWILVSLETEANWIVPLPSGSGFYRIYYGSETATIFLHPLPSVTVHK